MRWEWVKPWRKEATWKLTSAVSGVGLPPTEWDNLVPVFWNFNKQFLCLIYVIHYISYNIQGCCLSVTCRHVNVDSVQLRFPQIASLAALELPSPFSSEQTAVALHQLLGQTVEQKALLQQAFWYSRSQEAESIGNRCKPRIIAAYRSIVLELTESRLPSTRGIWRITGKTRHQRF